MTYPTLCFLSYERPQFLARAIETALAGVDEPVEVIVHDDGSANPELLKYLYTIHQRGIVSSVILNAPGVNQGQGVALNRMFRIASGDPIIKLDHDLIFKPDWWPKARAIIQGDERVGLLGLFKYWHDPVDWRKTLISDEQCREMGIEPPTLPQVGYRYHTHICGSAMVIPRAVWEELGPFKERLESFGEDWLFQQDIDAIAPALFNALPDEDLVENVGFGVGPSTVVVAGPEGPEPSKIHKLPMLVGGSR